MLLPEDFIDKVRERSDIVDVVSRKVNLRKAGHEYVALCPFHDEKSPSFTVSPVKQFYHCFGCGAHGDSFEFLMEHDGMSFYDAVETLATEAGMQMPPKGRVSKEDKQRQEKEHELYAILETARKHFCNGLRGSQVAIQYAKQRGMTGEVARQFGLGFAPGDDIRSAFEDVSTDLLIEAGLLTVVEETGEIRDKFRQRLMFPIQDEKGRVIGFGGRVIGNSKPKYLNSPESPVFHKGLELYGIYQAKQAIRQSRRAVLLEGYMDVVMLHQHGEHRAVAALGTSLTEEQVRRLYRMADEIIFCFDGDKAGQAAAARAVKIVLGELVDGKSARFVSLSEEHDPDSFVREFGLEAWHRAIEEQGRPLSVKLVEILVNGGDLSLPETRAAVAKEAEELIGLVGNAPLFRQALIQHVEGVIGFPLGNVPVRKSPPQRTEPTPAEPLKPVKGVQQAGRGTREDAVRPKPGKQQLYTNLATVCALDLEAVQRVPLEFIDDFAGVIIGWFSLAQNDTPEARLERLSSLPESVLRSFVHLGVQRDEALRPYGSEAMKAEIEALLMAFERVREREKKRDDFDSLFG